MSYLIMRCILLVFQLVFDGFEVWGVSIYWCFKYLFAPT